MRSTTEGAGTALNSARITLLLIAALVAVPGCGKTGPQRIAVNGTVTLNGLPVTDATIIFTPIAGGLAAAAEVKDGKFSLSQHDGPTAGEHTVQINPNEPEMVSIDPAEVTGLNRTPKIPPMYQRRGALTAIIHKEPRSPLLFSLSSH